MKKVLISAAGLIASLTVTLLLATGIGGASASSADPVHGEILEFAPWCDGQIDDTVYGCPIFVVQ